MDYVRYSISNPVKVAVGVLLVVLFGLLSLLAIPIQLVPNVDQPEITVTTVWTGRSPEEVEREIIEKQEDKLKGVTNLRKMIATASLGQAQISLEFFVGTNMDRALQEVSDKLREVPEYPQDVDEPVIKVADSASENAIAWFVIWSDDPDFNVQSLHDQLDKRVKPVLERVEGVAEINIYGGREHEVHIQIDPRRMAERGITFNQLRQALQLHNVNVSAGDLPSGRLDVRVRTIGQFEDLEELRQTIVSYSAGGPVRIRDLGDVELTLEKERAFVHSKGERALAMNAIRSSGSNVVAAMNGLRTKIDQVRTQILPHLGPKLHIEQVYDETIYIYESLQLVVDSLWQGGLLTVLVLLLFLRRLRPTFIVALAIPISGIGTFLIMTALGRNLNVVSIAGLAFAVGMVVDDAIVVLENIDRHLEMGKSPMRAAYDATQEVWGAILAATLTTLVVFLPVLFMQEEAGQLFRDLTLAICASVSLSLIVSVTVVPAAAARWIKPRTKDPNRLMRGLHSLFGLAPIFAWINTGLSRIVYWLCGSVIARILIVLLFTVGSLWGAILLMPPTTYLPEGNRNLVFGFMLLPPGYNIEHNKVIAERMEHNLRPYWEAKTRADFKGLPPVIHPFTQQPVAEIPPIANFFFVSFGGNIFYGAMSAEEQNVKPLEGLLQWGGSSNPGAIPLAFQMGLFGGGFGGGNSIDLEITGEDLNQIRDVAGAVYAQLGAKYGYQSVRPQPMNFNLPGPELQMTIDRVRAADLGVDVASLGLGVQALVDGAMVGEYRYNGDLIDIMVVRDPRIPLTPELIEQVPIAYHDSTGKAGTIPLGAIAHALDSTAPQEIRRIEQLRAVTLTFTPPPQLPLEKATTEVEELVQQLRDQKVIPPTIETFSAGTADKLAQVREAMLGKWHGWNWQSAQSLMQSRAFLALLICYLLMAALFESYLHPLVIMFTVPLGTIGGFAALAITHMYVPTQNLDVVTMLGFVILVGVVVDNAILLVYQALNYMKGIGESDTDVVTKLPPREAIAESVRTRIRPIMMTSLTTIIGLLPLVIKPGAGSELYRGLGAVQMGGMAVATVFTLLVIPLLFSLMLDAKIGVYRLLKRPVPELGETEQLSDAPAIAPASPPLPSTDRSR